MLKMKEKNTIFKNKLIEKLQNKNLADSTIKFYVRNIEKLAKTPLTNLTFLNNKDSVIEQLANLKPNTQRNYLISIVSILSTDPKKYRKLLDWYSEMMDLMNKELKTEEAKNIRSERQKANWITYEELIETYNKYKKLVSTFANTEYISENKYDFLLKYVILSLYVLIPPRRNKDYQNACIIKNEKISEDTINIINMTDKELIFNDFKTKKSEGIQTQNIPEDLYDVLEIYTRHHPLIEDMKKYDVPFLVDYEGIPLTNINAITVILNRIFQKNIGSTMLRHMYLTHKYGDVVKEQKEDAKKMAHSVDMQKDYIKNN